MSAITTTERPIPFFVPLLNPLMALFIKLGVDLGPKMALITVRGRKTGREHTTPVTLFETAGRRYLFGTFGNTSWVRNARAAGELTLTRGSRTETVTVVPIDADEAAGILRDCLMRYARNPMMAPFLKRFYGVGPSAALSDFTAISHEHPAFELRTKEAGDAR